MIKAGLAHRWFVTLHPFDDGNGRIARAVHPSQHMLDAVRAKTRFFWQRWAAITKCWPDTTLRDITDLLTRGVLRRGDAGGRSTRYELNEASNGHDLRGRALATRS